MLEGQNASMTTATMSFEELTSGNVTQKQEEPETPQAQEDIDKMEVTAKQEQTNMLAKYYDDNTIGDYSMNNVMDQQLMRNVEQFVLQNMSRGQISLEDIAAAMGMGRVPFFHKIRAITTKTPAEVVREIRLKHACTLLVTTNINLSELAINVGFMTAENFINIFKDKYGMTPLEYRLKNKR
jgi:AraC-like DNA-binding protein